MLHDGRHARSRRTRARIVRAFLSLLRRRPGIPSGPEISSLAGCSLRTLYERFPTVEALHDEAGRHIERLAGRAPPVPARGERHQRIRQEVDRRIRSCRLHLPLWRVALAAPAGAKGLRERLDRKRRADREIFGLVFAEELRHLGRASRDRIVLLAECTTSPASWALLREQYRSIAEIRALWSNALDLLLPRGEPVASAAGLRHHDRRQAVAPGRAGEPAVPLDLRNEGLHPCQPRRIAGLHRVGIVRQ